jgi:hypothetical protein
MMTSPFTRVKGDNFTTFAHFRIIRCLQVQDHSEGFCTMINRVVPPDPVKLIGPQHALKGSAGMVGRLETVVYA